MPRSKNQPERREQIIEALKAEMAEAGYAGASVQKIAKRAGLTAGLIHYHFKSKQEILIALVERLTGDLAERLDSLQPDLPDQSGPLDGLIDAWLSLGPGADPQSVACWVQIGAEALRQPAIRDVYRASISRAIDAFRAVIEEELGERGRSSSNAPSIAAALVARIEGYFHLASAAPDLVPPGSAAENLRAMARGLLLAQPSDSEGASR